MEPLSCAFGLDDFDCHPFNLAFPALTAGDRRARELMLASVQANSLITPNYYPAVPEPHWV